MLKKILEEIDAYITAYSKPPYGKEVAGTVELLQKCKEIIRQKVIFEGNLTKFYYCESEDDYYIGSRQQNMYYAKYIDGDWTWCMSKYLPWGKHIVAPKTLWKEHTYPSEPKEIPFTEWLEGFKRKCLNDGWIPVEERLPSEEEFIKAYCRNKYAAEFIVMIEGATLPTTLYFRNGIWADEENNHYKVTAWRPLPEPYCPEKGEHHA